MWVTGRAMELGRECLKAWGWVRVSLARSLCSTLTADTAQLRTDRRARMGQDESTSGLDTNRSVCRSHASDGRPNTRRAGRTGHWLNHSKEVRNAFLTHIVRADSRCQAALPRRDPPTRCLDHTAPPTQLVQPRPRHASTPRRGPRDLSQAGRAVRHDRADPRRQGQGAQGRVVRAGAQPPRRLVRTRPTT